MLCPIHRSPALSVLLALALLSVWGCGGEEKPAGEVPAALKPSLSRPGAAGQRVSQYLEERGPIHTTELFLFLQAYREIHPSGEILYFVDCNSVKLSPDDVRTVLQKYEQVKSRKKSESVGIVQAGVHWDVAGAIPNTSIRFSHFLGEEGIHIGLVQIKAAPAALKQVLVDIEALKKAKPSLTW